MRRAPAADCPFRKRGACGRLDMKRRETIAPAGKTAPRRQKNPRPPKLPNGLKCRINFARRDRSADGRFALCLTAGDHFR